MPDRTEPMRCPFDETAFAMDPREPCPVCGALGTLSDIDDLPQKCVAFRRAAQQREARGDE